MNTQDFCYWLQGFFELTGEDKLSEQQVKMIKEHLQLVFNKQTTITFDNSRSYTDGVVFQPMSTDKLFYNTKENKFDKITQSLNDFLVYDSDVPVSC